MGKALIIKGADFSANGIAADFTQLAWIGGATTSGGYINSGIFWGNKEYSLDDEMQFSVKLDATGLSTDNFYSIGAYINVNTRCLAWFKQSSVTFYFARNGNDTISPSVSLFDGQWHTISISKTKVKIDGTEYAWPAAPTQYPDAASSVYNNIPIYLDCASRSSGDGYNSVIDGPSSAMKIAWVKYYRSGTMILDCIPVKRKSDDKVGFYDRISGEYKFRNDGSTPSYGTT